MKRYFSILCAAIISVAAHAYYPESWELKAPSEGSGTVDDPYVLTNANDLYYFAQKVKNWTDACAVLANDITINSYSTLFDADGNPYSSYDERTIMQWAPMGIEDRIYNGTFDGQGYAIRGLYSENGLFGYIGTAVIKNLGIEESLIHGSEEVGSLVHYTDDKDYEISKCYSTATIISDGNIAGGIIGYSFCPGKLTDCYFAGKITIGSSTTTYRSGIIGYLSSNDLAKYHFTNCYSTLTETGTAKFKITVVQQRDVESGRLAWLMNGQTYRDANWYQRIGVDKHPTPRAGEDRIVYYDNSANLYTNEFTPQFDNGVALLYTEDDLEWFVRAVNEKTQTGLKVRLCGDITLPAGNWTPIGTAAHPFSGSFNGNGHTIRGLRYDSSLPVSVGFFGVTEGTTISSLTIEDAEIRVSSPSTIGVGLLCGVAHDTAFDHCVVRGQIISNTTFAYCGGLCGLLQGNNDVQSCYSAARVAAASSELGGALCGRAEESRLKGCHYLVDNNVVVDPKSYTDVDPTDNLTANGTVAGCIEDCTGHPFADFLSGAVCYALTHPGDVSDNRWGQNLATEIWPCIYATGKRKNEVYAMYYCFGEMTGEYTNSLDNSQKNKRHTAFDAGEETRGFSCKYCEVDPEEPALVGDERQIRNAGNLYWIAQHPVTGVTQVRLMNDIVVNDDVLDTDHTLKKGPDGKERTDLRKWVPIAHAVSINGDGHVIRGLYCVAENAALTAMPSSTIYEVIFERLGLEDSYMAGSKVSSSFGTVLLARVKNCYSTATLVAPTDDDKVYLLVDEMKDILDITNSWYVGRVIGGAGVGLMSRNTCRLFGKCRYALLDADPKWGRETWRMETTNFASGEVTWLLNGEKVGGDWYQTLEGDECDALPRFSGNLLVDYDGTSYYNISLCGGQARRHAMTHYVETLKTCLRDGCKDHYKCSLCNQYYSDNRGMKMVAEDDVIIRRKTAYAKHVLLPVNDYDCIKGGYYSHYLCSNCNNRYSAQVETTDKYLIADPQSLVRPAVGHHELAEVNAVKPTCFRMGVNKHWACKVCPSKFNDEYGIEAFDGDGPSPVGLGVVAAVDPVRVADGWTLLDEYDFKGTSLKNVLHTSISGTAEKTIDFIVPGRASEPKFRFIATSPDSRHRHSFKLILYVDDVAYDELPVTDEDGMDEIYGYDNTYFDDYPYEEGQKVTFALLPTDDYQAADCELYVQFLATQSRHDFVRVKADYDCLKGGFQDYYQCKTCSYLYDTDAHPWNDEEIYTEGIARSPLGKHAHRTQHDGLAPTCGTPGYDDYWTCDECDAILAENNEQASRVNSVWELPVIAPQGAHTFTAEGSIYSPLDKLSTFYCAVCQQPDTEHRYILHGIGEENVRLTVTADGHYHSDALLLADGTAYQSPVEFTADKVSYSRTLSNSYWMPLFLPFDVDYEDWEEKFDVAELQNVHQYTNTDGDVTRTVLEYVRLTNGKIEAGTPYVIRAKVAKAEPQTLVVNNAQFHASADKPEVWCASTKRRYNFVGTYEPLSSIFKKHYIAGDGMMYFDNVGISLKPLRWYMEEMKHDGTPLSDGYHSQAMLLTVVNDNSIGGSTGIIRVIEHNDGAPSRSASEDHDIYDLQGRAVTARGSKGVFISNGKKMIVR